MQALPAALDARFGQPMHLPSLDLSSLGYTFVRAENCHALGTEAVHLMYRSQSPANDGRASWLSVWVRPYEGYPDIKECQVHVEADARDPHPLQLWREAGVLYCVVGDSMEPVEQATELLCQPKEAGPSSPRPGS